MADEISIVVRAEDAFSGVLSNFGNIMTGIKSTIDLVSMAFDTARDFIEPFINSASESQLAIVGLETVLRSTGNTIGMTSQELQDLATSFQNTTRYSDEQILSAESMLLRYENINKDIFPEAIKLATDLAASLGIDLTSAARMVGMALDDPTAGIGRLNTQFRIFDDTQMDTIKSLAGVSTAFGALQVAGVELTEAQVNQIKWMGQSVGAMDAASRAGVELTNSQKLVLQSYDQMNGLGAAQMMILDGIKEKVGGAAEAFGITFAGQLDIAKNKLDDIRETIGGPILVVLSDLLVKFNDFLDTNPAIKATKDFFTDLKDLLDNNIEPLAALGIEFKKLGESTGLQAFTDLGSTLLLIRGYMASGDNPFEAITKSIDDMLAAHPDGPLAPIMTGIQEFIATGQSEGWGVAISGLLSDIWDSFNIPDKIHKLLEMLQNGITSFDWTPLANTLAGLMSLSFDIATDLLVPILHDKNWKPILDALWNGLINTFATVIDEGANKLIELMAKAFGDPDVATFETGVRIGFERFKAVVSNVWSTGWDDLLLDPNGIIPSIMRFGFDDILKGIYEGVVSYITWAWGNLRSIFRFVFVDIVNAVKDVLGIHSRSTVFYEIGVNIIQAFIDGWNSLWNGSLIQSLLGDGTISIGGATGTFEGFGGSPGRTGTSTSLGQTVQNYFYGPVYFSQSLQDTNYDCPSPNPFMTATNGSLNTSGI